MIEANKQASRDSGAEFAIVVAREVSRMWKEWKETHHHANILIAGKTGVGKSTIINTVFREELAKTGSGKPVTQGIEEISKPGVPITILDTKGLELADFERIRSGLIGAIEARRGEDADTYVHVAWLCIVERGDRVEEAELELAKTLKAAGLKVIVVITKVSRFRDNAFEQAVRDQFADITADVVLTRALAEDLYDDDDQVTGRLEVRGIDRLLDVTYGHMPESQRHAFANAASLKNKKALELKKGEVDTIINFFSGAAAVTGASPIPFSDAAILVPVQVGMIIKISQLYGIKISKDGALPLLSALSGTAGASLIGRTLVSGLLKLVPGVGTAAGATISAATALALTKSMGSLYAGILADMAERGEPLELGNALSVLKRQVGFAGDNAAVPA